MPLDPCAYMYICPVDCCVIVRRCYVEDNKTLKGQEENTVIVKNCVSCYKVRVGTAPCRRMLSFRAFF